MGTRASAVVHRLAHTRVPGCRPAGVGDGRPNWVIGTGCDVVVVVFASREKKNVAARCKFFINRLKSKTTHFRVGRSCRADNDRLGFQFWLDKGGVAN